MAVSLESQIETLTDTELQKCFIEIHEWHKVSGNLPTDALTRKVWNDYKNFNNQKDFPIHMMAEAIFYEICLRKYREEGIEFN